MVLPSLADAINDQDGRCAMAATLRQVAEKADVSIRTVTRALKNEPGGNADTYERVRGIAKRIGYVPNIAARNLKIQRSNMVGLAGTLTGTSAMIRVRNALQRLLEREGMYLLSGTIPEDEKTFKSMLMEWSGLVRHVVVMRGPINVCHESVFTNLPMKFVFVDYVADLPGYDAVLTDRVVGCREAVGHLLATGRRRVALCGRNMVTRRRGFEEAFANAGDSKAEKLHVPTRKLDLVDGYEAGPEIVNAGVDAVFFETDRMAFGFYKFAHEHGVRIPDDVAVVGFDDEPACVFACPPLSSVAHPIVELTEKAFAMIKNPSSEPRRELVPSKFIARESV